MAGKVFIGSGYYTPPTQEELDSIINTYVAAHNKVEFDKLYQSTLVSPDTNKDIEILAVTNIVMTEQSIKASDNSSLATNALTATFDSTTYPDHARITLKNERGFDVFLTQLVIDGQPIRRYKNTLVHDSLRRDDDIRKNGEKLFEIGNEYIIDGTQVDRIADFYYKDKGKKKHLYSVSIKGFCPWYSVGDWYTFALGAAGWNEHINSTVEVYDVTCSRTAGGIGSTTLVLREVEENWTKTTFYTARARSGASPKRRSQQSNTLIVAASTFDGTYDYKCDGTADDVEIQAAIDYIYTHGGGSVRLTEGTYKISTAVSVKLNVILIGEGNTNTIFERVGDIYCITVTGTAGNEITGFKVIGIGIINATGNTSEKTLWRIYYAKNFVIDLCSAYGCNATGIEIAYSENATISNFTCDTCAQSSTTVSVFGIGVGYCTNITVENCVSTNNGSATALGIGIFVNNSSYTVITNCTCNSNLFHGIGVTDGSNCRVTNCTCNDNMYDGCGIWIGFLNQATGCTDSAVASNQCFSNAGSGIRIDRGSRISIFSNIVKSNTVDGILITDNSDNNSITGNIGTLNAAGINISGATCNTNIVSSNRATGNTTNYSDTGTGTTTSGNDFT